MLLEEGGLHTKKNVFFKYKTKPHEQFLIDIALTNIPYYTIQYYIN